MEINSSPGLEGIENCTGLDVAGAFVDYMAAQVDFPEIDLKQRLSISKGYGVTELVIPKGSDYIGKTILEAGFQESDVNALSLHRNGKVIPSPKSERVLEPLDRLLCFGKLESMRGLVPEKTKKRRRPKLKKLDT
jgi:ribosomal protein S6--L-glutamate ligase